MSSSPSYITPVESILFFDVYIGRDAERELGRIGIACNIQCMYFYMYNKPDRKLATIQWDDIDRLEQVSEKQLIITFKHIPANIWLQSSSNLNFYFERVQELINELINMKLIKKCDTLSHLFKRNRSYYKPRGTAYIAKKGLMNVDFQVTEKLFEERDPEKVPLIEL